MPSKTTKKTVTKTTRKTPVKKTRKTVAEPVLETPVYDCPCQRDAGVGKCCCGHHCGCKSKCGKFFKRLIIIIILLGIGFYAGMRMSNCDMRGPRVKFAKNGCMVTESIKCPKLRDALPAMDINQDGCITKDEYRAVKRNMRREIREMPVQEDMRAQIVVVE